MQSILRALSFSLALVLLMSVAGRVEAAPVEIVLIEHEGVTGNDQAQGGRLPLLTVDRPIAITRVAQMMKFDADSTVTFVFFKKVGTSWVTDRDPINTPSGTSAAPVFVSSPAFAPHVLYPGNTYAIGATSMSNHTLYHAGMPPASNNGVNIARTLVVSDSNPPTSINETDFLYSLRLSGYEVPPVPTLSEWGMILMGLAMAGAAALSLRRRKAA